MARWSGASASFLLSRGGGVTETFAPPIAPTREKQRRPYGFQPGVSGNPHGRPKGAIDLSVELLRAVRRVEHTKQQPFLDHVIEVAYRNPSVMIAVLRKLVPEQTIAAGEPMQVINVIYPPDWQRMGDALRVRADAPRAALAAAPDPSQTV